MCNFPQQRKFLALYAGCKWVRRKTFCVALLKPGWSGRGRCTLHYQLFEGAFANDEINLSRFKQLPTTDCSWSLYATRAANASLFLKATLLIREWKIMQTHLFVRDISVLCFFQF